MKYLALVYYDEKVMERMSQQEWDVLNRECMECVASLTANGHFITGSPLLPTSSATTVRMRDNRITTTDGPFAETKEQLAGFYMLEARDLNEAIALAGKIPPARYGSIEVRPTRELREEGNQAGGNAGTKPTGNRALTDHQ
ncbi:YciI family protein [Microbulbifer harenosus]|uniref:YciI family protein n=1 Tax=Microbulbifer harenosus TaxID=2576840 RepID=A0ABY2UGX4_9GAMM|nr:YciI family protein [Microbulbifer harenosus]TLM77032.1 YciI family protein [Microbulbifer harenosus]